MKHHHQKQAGKERVYSACALIWEIFIKGVRTETQKGQERADGEAMQQCCLLASQHTLLSPLSSRTQDHQPRGNTTHNGLGTLPYIIN